VKNGKALESLAVCLDYLSNLLAKKFRPNLSGKLCAPRRICTFPDTVSSKRLFDLICIVLSRTVQSTHSDPSCSPYGIKVQRNS